ncbi:hypothetical protein L3C95_05045 [Chitinophaga filiformis]|uniref:hypothetical protein n=1 Tax=Chitinophaga filiformis TaxID=104663 RepID=UPI001F26EFB8|nr:hypothetical protein [Chitinophaga filiformis]MCF6402230.1 hypothetical protein [Chitinophaga filiformis]
MSDRNEEYLLAYLSETADEALKRHIDLLKLELDWHIYHYGAHFSRPKGSVVRAKIPLRSRLRNWYSANYQDHFSADKSNILSLIYFSGFNKHLEDEGYNLVSPYWAPHGRKVAGNASIVKAYHEIDKHLRESSFSYLMGEQFQQQVASFEQMVASYLREKDLRAALLFTGQLFYSKVVINCFRSMNRPSFILSHGLPAFYHHEAENNSDYLVVWGEQVRQNYLRAGLDPAKVLVAGHPSYSSIVKDKQIRFDLSDVLVLPKAMSAHQHTYEAILGDRGNIIVYLLRVKAVLQKAGIKRARLRPHPSMSGNWLLQFVGTDFYYLDTLSLSDSLNKASLVVGPTSTLLLESIGHGVNYLVYEPVTAEGKDLTGYEIVPPFDGSDKDIPVAKTDEALHDLIKNKVVVNKKALEKYLRPFDVSVIKNKL